MNKLRDYFIANLWRWKCGHKEFGMPDLNICDLDKFFETEWNIDFEKLMRNRLAMGAMRYGRLENHEHDVIGLCSSRLAAYKRTGNEEFLVDVANFAMVEYMRGRHPLRHFKTIDR